MPLDELGKRVQSVNLRQNQGVPKGENEGHETGKTGHERTG